MTEFPVHLFEEHSATLPVWWARRDVPLTVVYLDAHLDLQEVDAEKIQALAQCRSLEEVQSLEAPHHLDSSNRWAFGIENFLYPAHRLGLIERLVWVAPPHVPRVYSRPLLEYVQQLDGITFEELTGFTAAGRDSLRGSLLGLDITICDAGDLGNLDIPEDYCLDIDIDYFVTVPGDTLWTDPGGVVRGMLERLGRPRLATVSRAVGSGFTPLQHRFVGDYAAAILSGDEDAARHYHDLYRAAASLDNRDRSHAASLCRTLLKSRPACAATCFLLAGALEDPDESRAMRARAIELDPAYGLDLARDASAFPNRRKPLDGKRLRALAAGLASLEPGSDERAFAEIAVARLCAEAGMPGEALRLLQRPLDESMENSEVLLAVAGAFLAGDEPLKAQPFLARARGHDKTRTSATLHLGDLAMRAGQANRARALYEEVAARAPAWSLPLERLRLCHQALGDPDRAGQLTARIAERENVLAGLVAGCR